MELRFLSKWGAKWGEICTDSTRRVCKNSRGMSTDLLNANSLSSHYNIRCSAILLMKVIHETKTPRRGRQALSWGNQGSATTSTTDSRWKYVA